MAERRYAPRSDWLWGMGHQGIVPGPCYDDGVDTYHVKTAPGSDLCQINDWLRRLNRYGKGHEAYRAKLDARAQALVDQLWPEIQIVARELLARKKLSHAELRRLMNRARR
jgi:hypothetical protein